MNDIHANQTYKINKAIIIIIMDEPIDKLLDEMNEVFDKSFDNEC